MKNKILAVVKELNFATAEEIKFALGDVKLKTLQDNIGALVSERDLIKLTKEENSLSKEGFIVGPNFEVEEDIEIKKVLSAGGYSKRETVIDWRALGRRLTDELTNDINNLREDIEKLYDKPKNLQMRYFDLAIRYHELYSLLYENYETEDLKICQNTLDTCKVLLDKLDYKETP